MKQKRVFMKGALCGALAMLLISAAGCAAMNVVSGLTNLKENPASNETGKKLQKIQKIVDDKYLYADEADEKAMIDGIYQGYVGGLGDPYSVYYNEDATKELRESTAGEFSGIGATLSQDRTTGIITLTKIFKNSPAEEAGLKEGDILYQVAGKDVADREVSDVVKDVKGEEGTTVDIVVLRGERSEKIEVTATRRKIEVETVEFEMKEDNIGYISVMEFDDVTFKQYEEALNTLEAQGMKGLVVDLRSNPGGNLSTVCDMLDLMLPKGVIVYTEDKEGERQYAYSDEERQFKLPMAVLVNGYSASASEIYAGAIQDYKLGDIIGTTSFGKGIVQQIFDMKDGTSLKLTVSEYFTPKGRNIHGKGIEPDVVVEYKPNEKDETADNQLDAALENVKQKIK